MGTTDNLIFLPNGMVAERAEYKEQYLPEYSDNPLIEALPEIFTKEQVADAISVYPIFSQEEKNLPPEIRIHCIQRLFQYFQPFPQHFDLQQRFSAVIRQGYIARNPFRPEYATSFRNGYEMIKKRNIYIDCKVFRTTSAGFTIIGISGIGKTTSVDRILSQYPQIIVHSQYKNMPFSVNQLTWAKLNCPFDGSLKGLCKNFFLYIDDLLGTTYDQKFGNSRNAANAMMPYMAQVAREHSIGVLIIDEIQHLNLAKSGGSEEMLNFFVTLVNTIGVPVVLIGTMKALPVLQREFRQARRGSGQGDMVIDRMHKDITWDLLMGALLPYQWTKKEIAQTDEISDVLYDESQGIIDIAVKLYAFSQIIAVTSGKEIVTPSLIRQVAKTHLKLLQPMLDALKTGNIEKIIKYADICTVDVESFFKEQESILSSEKAIQAIKATIDRNNRPKHEELKETAIIRLMDLGIDSNKAKILVEQVIKTEPGFQLNEIVIKAIASMQEEQNSGIKKVVSKPKNTQRKNPTPVKDDNDLRVIAENAKNSKTSAYEGLKSRGYIKPPLEDIFKLG